MNTFHTPGPWDDSTGGNRQVIGITMIGAGDRVIALVQCGSEFTPEERAANVALIKTAPKLLNLLVRVQQHGMAASFPGFVTELEDALRAAGVA